MDAKNERLAALAALLDRLQGQLRDIDGKIFPPPDMIRAAISTTNEILRGLAVEVSAIHRDVAVLAAEIDGLKRDKVVTTEALRDMEVTRDMLCTQPIL